MELLPKHILSTLEFDKIIHILKQHCQGEYGRQYFHEIGFSADPEKIRRELTETSDYKKILQGNHPLHLQDYEDIQNDLSYLDAEGYVLSIEALRRIDVIVKNILVLIQYFRGENRISYPGLSAISEGVEVPDELKLGLERILDEQGEIRPDASPTLKMISKAIHSKTAEINQRFTRVSHAYRDKGWLSDTVESYRNSRRVLSAPAEFKRKIRGIIHDESASGKTVYIEPEELIPLNNDLFDLESDYRKEVYKILKELSNQLRPFREELGMFYQLNGIFDVIRAKARLAVSLKAEKVEISDKPGLGFLNARHPLLILKNAGLGLPVVPFDMELKQRNKIIVLSGPNAGGKSVTLKTVGLLQLMVQAGMLIPTSPDSRIGIFSKIFADIGDQQSLEDDLSTYSSRLANMKAFLEKADRHTLFLIDEFGSGTDPQIGGAIAEAILRSLKRTSAFGLVTTHYSNLKFYAFKTQGIINASMTFDKKQFVPTYELVLGKPGSSFAFEIAQKTGLGSDILKYARFRTGKNVKKIEELVIELQSEKQELEKSLAKVESKEKQLDTLIRNYDKLHRDLDYKRKKLKLEKKELSIIDLNKYNRELEKIIKDIKESQKLEKAMALSRELKEKRLDTIEQAEELAEAVMESTRHDWKDLKTGDFVKLKTGSEVGKITAIRNKKAEVEIGLIKMSVKLSELVPADRPIDKYAGHMIKAELNTKAEKFNPKIDIRGYSKSDAFDTLQEFLDQAILANASFLQILHGKGNGVLRKLVREKLREYNDVESITHPSEENGGNGITLVTLK